MTKISLAVVFAVAAALYAGEARAETPSSPTQSPSSRGHVIVKHHAGASIQSAEVSSTKARSKSTKAAPTDRAGAPAKAPLGEPANPFDFVG